MLSPKPLGISSPGHLTLDPKSRTIIIKYNEHILDEPGIEKNLNSFFSGHLVAVIKNSFKREVCRDNFHQ